MAKIVWDAVGEHFYETGVDHAVLYVYNTTDNKYNGETGKGGVAWNGVSSIQESPSGADANDIYADNVKYLSIRSAEEFGATIEAYTYPDEWGVCDGSAEVIPGLKLGQQTRKAFGLAYRTTLGNDTEGNDHGYLLHLIYNATAAPSSRNYTTINDNPEAISFSWEVSCLKVNVKDYKPVANITIDSTKVDAEKLQTLLDVLYGKDDGEEVPYLPMPDEVIAILGGVQSQSVG